MIDMSRLSSLCVSRLSQRHCQGTITGITSLVHTSLQPATTETHHVSSQFSRKQRLQATASHHPESSDSDRGILFPIETWKIIFDMAIEESTDSERQKIMNVLVRTCSAFQFEAERLLYGRVNLTRGVAQLHSFKSAISTRRRRAQVVVFLHIAIPPRYGDGLARDIFNMLPNLVELQVNGMAEPRAVFARPAFRLHTLVISGDSLRYLHGVEDCTRNPDHLTSEHNTPFHFDFLSSLTTLTLVQPFDPLPFPVTYESYRRLMRYCSFYGITHLSLVFGSSMLCSSAFQLLGDRLLSFRITTRRGRPPVEYVDWLSGPAWWPTHFIRHSTCPRLLYFELCQSEDYTVSSMFVSSCR